MGLFKKVVIANVAGELVHRYLDADLAHLSVGEGWFGLAAYTLQIYFDFSGYSDMAIGLGRMFGFHYQENFDHPYVARSVTEFWRRWHISLSTFFRDYVYIPLGGKERWPYRNLFIVWGLTGLWHGASWNFVLWGLYYGAFIALERLVLRRVLERLPRAFQHAYLRAWWWWWAGRSSTSPTCAGSARSSKLLFGFTGAALVGPDLAGVLREHVFWLAMALALCTPVAHVLRARLERAPAPRGWPAGGEPGHRARRHRDAGRQDLQPLHLLPVLA